MITAGLVAGWILAHPGWIDRDVTREQREPMVQRYAQAIAEEARSPWEAALALSQGWSDTKFAHLVLEGRCSEMPRGQRCDGGAARGAFSEHVQFCPLAYVFRATSLESVRAEVHCVLAKMRGYSASCLAHNPTPWHAAFAGLALGHCGSWNGSDDRVKLAKQIAAELERAEAKL